MTSDHSFQSFQIGDLKYGPYYRSVKESKLFKVWNLKGEERYISVCGRFYCKLCPYHTGSIVDAAKQLLPFAENVGSLRLMADLYGTCNYDEFLKGVRWLSSRPKSCAGCRFGGGWSWWRDCPVRDCCIERGLEFCYQCDEFPCDRLTTGSLLKRKKDIIETNEKMRKIPLSDWVKVVKNKYTREDFEDV
jgi:hypothetical protein